MKKLFLFLFLTAPLFAQNWRYDSFAFGTRGPVPNATIAVCTQPANTSTTPCSPLATLCSSLSDGTCTSPNPITADALGNYHFYAKVVQLPVTVQVYGPQVATPFVITDQSGLSFLTQQVFQGGVVIDVSGTGCTKTLNLLNTDASPTNPNKYFRVNQSTGALELVNNACSTTIFSLDDSGNQTLAAGLTTTKIAITGFPTVLSGVPTEVGNVDLPNLSNSQGATLYTAPGSSGSCPVRVSWTAIITQAATSSSTLGGMNLTWFDPDTGFGNSVNPAAAQLTNGTIATSSAANTVGTLLYGLPAYLIVKCGTAVTYNFSYASSGATPMKYRLSIRAELMN